MTSAGRAEARPPFIASVYAVSRGAQRSLRREAFLQSFRPGVAAIFRCASDVAVATDAVNKADRPEADKLVKELTAMTGWGDHYERAWMIPVLKTEAVHDVGNIEQRAAWDECVGQGRLRPYSVLAETLARW